MYGNIVGQFEGSLVGDVSGTDASFVDISATNFYGTHFGSVIGDVSGTDASFVDISSTNIYATSIFGEHRGDISGDNAKFVDISGMNIYLNEEGNIYVGDQIFSGGYIRTDTWISTDVDLVQPRMSILEELLT